MTTTSITSLHYMHTIHQNHMCSTCWYRTPTAKGQVGLQCCHLALPTSILKLQRAKRFQRFLVTTEVLNEISMNGILT